MTPPSGPSPSALVEARFGESIDAIADHYRAQRPAWVTGDTGVTDARFLLREALDAGTSYFVEVGTASGMSTGLLCFALDILKQADLVGDDYRVVSYDISDRFYADRSHRVGDAAREILGDDLLAHVVWRNPALALDAAKEHAPGSVKFLFIDASHSHPWPALDLLATLPMLATGATVVLHDVNLPIVMPQFQDWGAYFLFHGLADVEKRLAPEGDTPGDPPNVGSVVIPEDRDAFRAQLVKIVRAHAWETEIPDDVQRALLGSV